MNNHNQFQSQTGFALLMSLVVVGVLISIGLTVLELSIKQVQLSTNARDSEIAFHAANAGMECGRYVRRDLASAMEIGSPITPDCFNGTLGVNTHTELDAGDGVSGDGEVFLYDYEFTWGENNDRCTEITTLVASSTIGSGVTNDIQIGNMTDHIPGFAEGDTKVCEAGARCTVISVRGYNRPCATASNYGTVQREVLLQF